MNRSKGGPGRAVGRRAQRWWRFNGVITRILRRAPMPQARDLHNDARRPRGARHIHQHLKTTTLTVYLVGLLSCSSAQRVDCDNIEGYFESTYRFVGGDTLRWAADFDACQEASFRFAQQGLRSRLNSEARLASLLRVYLWEMPGPSGDAPAVPAADIELLQPMLASGSPSVRKWSATILEAQHAQGCGAMAAEGLRQPGNEAATADSLASLVLTSGPPVDCGRLIDDLKRASLAPGGQAGEALQLCANAQRQRGMFLPPDGPR